VWKDTTGIIDHAVLVTVLTTNSIAVTELRRDGNEWIHDGTTLGRDASVTLNFTAAGQQQISAFAIHGPGSSSKRILFIAGNNDAGTDTFEVDSIDLTVGEGLTATAVTIAGSNQPTDTNTLGSVSCAATTTSLLTIFQDDGHTAVISGAEDGFTFTYTASKVTAIDTTIAVTGDATRDYFLFLIGTKLLLSRTGGGITGLSFWEMTSVFGLTDEFLDTMVGGGGSGTDPGAASTTLVPIAGQFALARPGMSTNGSDPPAYKAIKFSLDGLTANS
jgi:hypothetical protein